MMRLMLGLIALLVTHTASAATVIHAGFLFDTKRGEVAEQQTITIEGGRILSVQKGLVDVANADVINLRDAYV